MGGMSREECEEKIKSKVREIQEIYKEYNPLGNYMFISMSNNCITFNNQYWGEDITKPINHVSTYESEEYEDEI